MAGIDAPKCGANGKQIFETREEARKALGVFAHARGSRKVYRCPFGEHYHLTKGARGPKRGNR